MNYHIIHFTIMFYLYLLDHMFLNNQNLTLHLHIVKFHNVYIQCEYIHYFMQNLLSILLYKLSINYHTTLM